MFNYKPRLSWLLIVSFLIVSAPWLKAGNDTPIPLHPDVRTGKLANGMKYYIMPNGKPEKRAEFRLAVNAGSMMEDSSQQGLAHFVEHMCFNGTKSFKKNDLVNYLESQGVKFGPHLNAYTSFDETVYMFQLPTDKPEAMDKGLQILQEWAHDVTFDDKEIDKERGVVIEEWRLGLGAESRMWDKNAPVIFKDSRYATRLPIGKKEILEKCSYETLRRFYKEWYRPDLMAVIVVGDVNPDQIEKMIKERFSQIPNPATERPRTFYPVPDHKETLVTIASDKEAMFSTISLQYKHAPKTYTTEADYRQQLLGILYQKMFNDRMEELKQQGTPPFTYAYAGYGRMVRTKDAYTAGAMVGESGLLKGIEVLLTEDQRIKQFGFTNEELERAKKSVARDVESQLKEKDKTESGQLVWQLVSNFLSGDPFTSPQYDFDMVNKVFPTLKVEEVNALANDWIRDEDLVVTVNAPDKPGVKLPDEKSILALIAEVKSRRLEPRKERVLASSLLDPKAVKPGSIVSESKNDKLGVTEWKLSNGARVLLKPTDFKNDEVLFSATSPGGTSLYSDADYQSARYSTIIQEKAGLADFNETDLQKMLAGKQVDISPFVSSYKEGFNGSCSPADMESMLQLLYLYFTQPRKDEAAFQAAINEQKMFYQNLSSNPANYFNNEVSRFLFSNNVRAGFLMKEEDFNKINTERAYQIFKERFSNGGDFTYVFVGNFNPDKIKPLIASYIGGLPSVAAKEKPKDVGMKYRIGKDQQEIKRGEEPKSNVSLNFTGKFDWNTQNRHYMNQLTEVLRIKLRESLREEKGGVYGVNCSASMEKFPLTDYRISISFTCAPERADSLIALSLEEVNKVKANGPTAQDLQKVKEMFRRDREVRLKNNQYWISGITTYYDENEKPEDFLALDQISANMTAKDIQTAAQTYFNDASYLRIVMMPEKPGPSGK